MLGTKLQFPSFFLYIQGGLSWDSETLREKLESIFEKLEPYQSKLKVGYEARYFITMTAMFIARIQTLGTTLEAALPYYLHCIYTIVSC